MICIGKGHALAAIAILKTVGGELACEGRTAASAHSTIRLGRIRVFGMFCDIHFSRLGLATIRMVI